MILLSGFFSYYLLFWLILPGKYYKEHSTLIDMSINYVRIVHKLYTLFSIF